MVIVTSQASSGTFCPRTVPAKEKDGGEKSLESPCFARCHGKSWQLPLRLSRRGEAWCRAAENRAGLKEKRLQNASKQKQCQTRPLQTRLVELQAKHFGRLPGRSSRRSIRSACMPRRSGGRLAQGHKNFVEKTVLVRQALDGSRKAGNCTTCSALSTGTPAAVVIVLQLLHSQLETAHMHNAHLMQASGTPKCWCKLRSSKESVLFTLLALHDPELQTFARSSRASRSEFCCANRPRRLGSATSSSSSSISSSCALQLI